MVGLGLIINILHLINHGRNKKEISLPPLIKILKEVLPYLQLDLRWPAIHLKEIGPIFILTIYKVVRIYKISVISLELPQINLRKL